MLGDAAGWDNYLVVGEEVQVPAQRGARLGPLGAAVGDPERGDALRRRVDAGSHGAERRQMEMCSCVPVGRRKGESRGRKPFDAPLRWRRFRRKDRDFYSRDRER